MKKMIKKLGIGLTSCQIEKLLHYSELLFDGLKEQRLTGEKTLEDIINKQLYDSIYPIKLFEIDQSKDALDLGTGGGLPGIPLKICLPTMKFTFMDSNKRKMNFIYRVVQAVELEKVRLLCGRAEYWGQIEEHRERYDYVFSKAVAEMNVLVEYTLPLTRVGGENILYKGPRGNEELLEAFGAVEQCGGEIIDIYDYKLISGEMRKIIRIIKKRKTPEKYPRPTGRPGKKPLR
ncbi:MAG: 16S rRNA (guanine(527)-N(7))-methyltransferase RsmG [Bacillota bacterium]|nr:16S rRNA (guanine(527)-N(7))-methyltransferase RsmG [Bacillota bacterium]